MPFDQVIYKYIITISIDHKKFIKQHGLDITLSNVPLNFLSSSISHADLYKLATSKKYSILDKTLGYFTTCSLVEIACAAGNIELLSLVISMIDLANIVIYLIRNACFLHMAVTIHAWLL